MAARVVATCPPKQRAAFEAKLLEDAGTSACARRSGLRLVVNAASALKLHGGLGANDALVSLVSQASPLCDTCQALERMALDKLRTIAQNARSEWLAIEDQGVEALLALRSMFQSSRFQRHIEDAVRDDEAAMRAMIGEAPLEAPREALPELPRVGRTARRKPGRRGSLVQV